MPLRLAHVDGNFRVPRAESPLAFTGERLTSAVAGQIEFEHYHRYCMARDFCDGRDVIDVASGEGYGAALLAGIARSVVGVEIDADSVAHAEASYRSETLQFRHGDALAMPLDDACADVVVSFETLEHVADHGRFLGEVRRVLRPGGLLIVSTPDRAVYSAPGSDPNPYHVLELTYPEFRALLESHFDHIRILSQRPVLGSLMAAEESSRWRSYERRGVDIVEATGGLARADYLIGMASDDMLPEAPSSIYLDRRRVHDVMQDVFRLPAADAEIFTLSGRLAEITEQEAELSARNADLTRRVTELHSQATEILRVRDEARAESSAAAETLAAVEGRLRAAEQSLVSVEARMAEQLRELAAATEANLRLSDRATAAGEEAARTAALLAEAQQHRDAAKQELSVAQARVSATEAALEDTVAGRDQAEAALTGTRQMLSSTQCALAAAELAAAEAERAANRIIYSTSWRLLSPVRAAGSRFPRLARMLRRTIKVLWWLVTLQIGHRYMMWRLYRPQRLANARAPATAVPPPQATPEIAFVTGAEGAPPAIPADRVAVIPPRRSLREAFVAWHASTPIYFPPIESPDVSVVIPAYRGLADLENCLRSLSLHRATEPSFEVILLDDSPDAPVLWAIPNSGGLIKLANPENQGFLLTCRRGAAAARGRILCFLNSDTIVSAGWLRRLVEALDEVRDAALAGGMLLNEDGTIQDAGWRMLANGWGHPIGRGQAAEDGAYTYRRVVDCVTGACFVIARELYETLEGFDTAYVPAFYEEFDLAFRARARGMKVIYEPRSRVVHLGSASYGAAARDRLSTINHDRFVTRFADTLRHQPSQAGDEFLLRHVEAAQSVLLVVDYGVPQPDRHAGDVTISRYLEMLAQAGWRVVFGPFNGVASGPAAEMLERQGIELIRAPQTVEGWLRLHGAHVRQVWLARPDMAETLIGVVRATTSAPIAYYTHDLHHLRLEREAKLNGELATETEAARVRARETWIFNSVDHVTSPSREEAELIRVMAPATPVTVLPPYFYDDDEILRRDAEHFGPLSDVVFVGGFPHPPNVDAALFAAHTIMPLVWRERPDARLLLVGYAPPPEVCALAGPMIIVTGQVPRTEPFLERARLVLAPLRYGAGVKGKTVDALRFGVPVVTTAIGAEGVGIEPGRHAMLAEDAESLAACVLALLGDAERCAALSFAGTELVRAKFSRAAAKLAASKVFMRPCAAETARLFSDK